MTTLPLGKLAPDHSKRHLALAPYLTAPITAIPVHCDWLSRVDGWPMYRNDEIGDCVWAMIGHAIKAWTTYAGMPLEVTLDALLKGYHDVAGWVDGEPATDRGTVIQEALQYWKTHGVAGHKILAFAKVNHRDADEMKAAINLFGALLVGIDFPVSAAKQFAAGKPWTLVGRDGGSEGGHAIHVGQFEPKAYKLTTWGRVQTMTDSFADKYVDEAWVVITPEWLTAAGTTPTGLDLHGLGEALSQLTGQPNPFPTGGTTPPAPVVNDAAAAFAAVLHQDGWVDRTHIGFYDKLAAAGRAWLKSAGL